MMSGKLTPLPPPPSKLPLHNQASFHPMRELESDERDDHLQDISFLPFTLDLTHSNFYLLLN